MNVQLRTALSLISGAVLGAWAVKAWFPPSKSTTITIYRNDLGELKSETKDKRVWLRKLQFISWRIKVMPPLTIPDSAIIALRFRDDISPVTHTSPDDKKSSRSDRRISDIVPSGAKAGTYCYCVWLVDGATEILLEDPELIIEGDFRHKG